MSKKKQFLYGFLAFTIPILMMAYLYLRWRIYPGSSRTLISGDGITQFANFYNNFHDVLRGKESGLYSFHAGMGLNYYAFISYYLGGFLTPIIFFFSKSMIPTAYYVLTLLKFGFSGLAFWIYAKETFKVKQPVNLALAVAYSLMSFTIAHSEVIIWLDIFIYLPLVILGIDRLLDKRKPKCLFFSYLALFLTNYYFGFMIGVFSFIYFCIPYCLEYRKLKSRLIPYFVTSLLAGFASMVMILPMFIDLHQNGQPLATIDKIFVKETGFFDVFVKNLIGAYDTTKFETIAFIYIGLIPLIFAIYYFCTKKVELKTKIGYGLLGLIVFASFYIWPMSLFWQGFHAPNMFHVRYSFLFSFFVIMMAGKAMSLIDKEDLKKLTYISVILVVMFAVAIIINGDTRYYWIVAQNVALTLLFMVVYLFYFRDIASDHASSSRLIVYLRKHRTMFFVCLMLLETLLNAHFVLNKMHRQEWPYLMAESYYRNEDEMRSLVNKADKLNNGNFYHFESVVGSGGQPNNDGFRYNYSGLHMFSSIRNCNVSEVLNGLGFRNAQVDGLTVDYMNNTLLMDSLMGVRYNVAEKNPQKYGFKKIAKAGKLYLYENKNALPAGIIAKGDITKFKMSYNNPLIGQKNFLEGLTGQKYDDLYTEITPKLVGVRNIVSPKPKAKTISLPKNSTNTPRYLEYEVTIPAGMQAYFELLPAKDVYKNFEFTTWATVTSPKYDTGHKQILSLGPYCNLGIYNKEQKINFTVKVDGRHDLKIKKPKVLLLNLNTYQQIVDQLQTQGVEFQMNKRFAKADVDLAQDSNIFTTIPYDQGWTLKIDGKKAPIKTVNKGFIQVHVPKGKHSIRLSYFPPGLKIGIIMFISCSLLFVVFDIWYERRKRD